jgi:hypothetical protein
MIQYLSGNDLINERGAAIQRSQLFGAIRRDGDYDSRAVLKSLRNPRAAGDIPAALARLARTVRLPHDFD